MVHEVCDAKNAFSGPKWLALAPCPKFLESLDRKLGVVMLEMKSLPRQTLKTLRNLRVQPLRQGWHAACLVVLVTLGRNEQPPTFWNGYDDATPTA